jgi:hypothetical protein
VASKKLGQKRKHRQRQGQGQEQRQHKHASPSPSPSSSAPLSPTTNMRKRSPALETYKNTLPSPKTRNKVHNKLNPVFNALGIPGLSIEEKAEFFAKKAKDAKWLKDAIESFAEHGKERVNVKKNLSAITLKL